MILDTKSIDIITEEDLQSLVHDRISESKNIEYKRDNYGGKDNNKKEFLKDISSFANASGGYLIIGIEEDKGLPIKIQGVEVDNIDQEKLRFENLMIDQIRPRIPSYKIKEVELKSSRYVIIIHIPQTFAFPHMVTFNKTNKFYSRNSAGAFHQDIYMK